MRLAVALLLGTLVGPTLAGGAPLPPTPEDPEGLMRQAMLLASSEVCPLSEAAGAIVCAQPWVARYSPPDMANENTAWALALDPDGARVYVTGESGGGTAQVTYQDYATIAYDAINGTQLWSSRYDGGATQVDSAYALAVDPDGSKVYVTGRSRIGRDDYATIAYDAENGSQIWTARYNGPGNYDDSATAITVSSDGERIFVTGSSWGVGDNNRDYATIAYDAENGTRLWLARFEGQSIDQANAIGLAPDNSLVYVTGFSGGIGTGIDALTIAYDAATGVEVWSRRHATPGDFGQDSGDAISVDPTGNAVYVAGRRTIGGNSDAAVLAYAATTGTPLWVTTYNGPGNGADWNTGLAISSDGSQLFAVGATDAGNQNVDYSTIAIATSDGTRLWVARHDGPAGGYDVGRAIGLSPDDATVYVTGSSYDGDSLVGHGGDDYGTIAYDAQTGEELWTQRYDGTGHAGDVPYSLGVSPNGAHIFLTGQSAGPEGVDYATVAYLVNPLVDLSLVIDIAGEFNP